MIVTNICWIGIAVKLLIYKQRGCADDEYGANEVRILIDVEKAVALVKPTIEPYQF